MNRFHNSLALLALASAACLASAVRADEPRAGKADAQNRAGQQEVIKGKVQSVSDQRNQIVVRDENNRDWAIQIAKDARVRVNDKDAQARDLKEGDQVAVSFRRVARDVVAAQDEKAGRFVAGRVERAPAEGNQLVLKDHEGQEHTFQVGQNADIRVNGKSGKLSNLKQGDHVVVAYSKNGDASEASEVMCEGENQGAGMAAGQVESVDQNQIVLKDQAGHEHTFQLGRDAQVRVNNRDGKASDLQQGNQAAIAYARVASEVTGQRGEK